MSEKDLDLEAAYALCGPEENKALYALEYDQSFAIYMDYILP